MFKIVSDWTLQATQTRAEAVGFALLPGLGPAAARPGTPRPASPRSAAAARRHGIAPTVLQLCSECHSRWRKRFSLLVLTLAFLRASG